MVSTTSRSVVGRSVVSSSLTAKSESSASWYDPRGSTAVLYPFALSQSRLASAVLVVSRPTTPFSPPIQATSWAQLKFFPSSNRAVPPFTQFGCCSEVWEVSSTLCLSVRMVAEYIDVIRWYGRSCLRMMVMMFSLTLRSVKTRTSQSNFLSQCSDLYPTWCVLISDDHRNNQEVIKSTVLWGCTNTGRRNKPFVSLSRSYTMKRNLCRDLFCCLPFRSYYTIGFKFTPQICLCRSWGNQRTQ